MTMTRPSAAGENDCVGIAGQRGRVDDDEIELQAQFADAGAQAIGREQAR